MEADVLNKFQDEIEYQCTSVFFAEEDLRKALADYTKAHREKFKNAEERIYIYRIWYFIQALIVAAANISKLLDPIEPQRPHGYPRKKWKIEGPKLWKVMDERGVELRKMFSINRNSQLLNRKARDYLEHFDAFFQEWIEDKKGLDVPYAHRSIGSLRRVKEEGQGPGLKDFLQYLDTEEYILLFRGTEYPLKPIIEDVKKLMKEIEHRKSVTQSKGCQWS